MFHIDFFFEYSSGMFIRLNLLQSRILLLFLLLELIIFLFSTETDVWGCIAQTNICADQVNI